MRILLRILVASCTVLELNSFSGWITTGSLSRRSRVDRQSGFAPPAPRATPAAGVDVVVSDEATTPAANETEEASSQSAYDVLLDNIASCLTASDLKRDRGTDGAATGWTAWIDERSAYRLQNCIHRIRMAQDNDVSLFWSRWLKTAPKPFVIDMTKEVRTVLNETVSTTFLESIGTTIDEFLGRISLRLLVLPSGSSLPEPITAPTGAMVYGKLLYGGVTRFRLIGNGTRRAGERQMICAPGEATRGWLQYGGSPRNYVAVDMGACLVMELELSPKGPELAMMGCADPVAQAVHTGLMSATGSKVLSLEDFLEFKPPDEDSDDSQDSLIASDAEVSVDVCDLEDYFCTSTGGLRRQIDEIVRRVLDGRVVRPVDETSVDADTTARIDRVRREEMKGLLELGLHPPKGLLLYGPPGCGKTQLAREISTILNARPPKIVAAPELLDRWVGGSEKLIRELFSDAEDELRACNGDATKSALHVIVIDECDAVFRHRTSQDGASETTRASAVNQLLSKLDGVNALENILLIGMTNRRELLDPALLRPGRLEVHIEIPLPHREGRRDILNIHFDELRKRGRLSQPLMEAIDGRKSKLTQMNQRWLPQRSWFWSSRRSKGSVDLASDQCTYGFSGADIAGLVRCAGSIALARTRQQDDGSLDSLVITMEDVFQALEEVKAGRF